jgi:hypothetical protein
VPINGLRGETRSLEKMTERVKLDLWYINLVARLRHQYLSADLLRGSARSRILMACSGSLETAKFGVRHTLVD